MVSAHVHLVPKLQIKCEHVSMAHLQQPSSNQSFMLTLPDLDWSGQVCTKPTSMSLEMGRNLIEQLLLGIELLRNIRGINPATQHI